MLIKQLRKLVTGDYPKKYEDLVEPLAFVLNPFIESLLNALNRGLSFNDNFNADYKDIEVKLPLNNYRLLHNVKGKVSGVIVARVLNLENNAQTLTTAPHVDFTLVDEQVIQITNITGLEQNVRYKLRILLLGD